MKKILLFCMALMAMASCTEEEPTKKEEQTLELSKTELSFSQAAESQVVSVTTNGVWYVENNSDWVTVSPMGGKGDAEITVSVAQNTTDKSREASFSVVIDSDSKIVAVSQSATNTPSEEDNGGDSGEDNNNTMEYVDLGLSVKWATCNIGASKPEEYGNYYAWGESVTRELYDFSTYKYCNGSSTTMTKYCTNSDEGTVDNKTTLEKSDDVAYTTLGGKWRMPTSAEWEELLNNCTWALVTVNEVEGYKLEANNGNSIFLPLAGFRWDGFYTNSGFDGHYWSSTVNVESPSGAKSFLLEKANSTDAPLLREDELFRSFGCSIRAVLAE